ncbi:MAG: membrane protein insertase YidC [Gammaproteobacteria bacterium RIFCSPLOWO2_02_FULL_38_11]|nr:MAG: membrane protein insertase YidC [Gammaproteobacteria bacterium RIFCSPLOWO2_02_FULL_38_11]
MNYVRIALYGVLFLLVTTLFNLWDKEHSTSTNQATTSSSSQKEKDETGIPLPSLPTTSGETKQTQATSSKTVLVKTDVINAILDLKGGNIVNLNLPTYPESLEKKNSPYQLLSDDPENYYVVQAGIRNANAVNEPIFYQAQQTQFELKPGQTSLQVILNGKNNKGIDFKKIYTFTKQSYLIEMVITATNTTSSVWEGQGYEQLVRKNVEKKSSLMNAFNFSSFLGAAYSTQQETYQKLSFKKMENHALDQSSQQGWVAMIEHYFLSAWVPINTEHENLHFYTQASEEGLYSVGIFRPVKLLEPGKQMTQVAKLYVGPLITRDLEKIAPHLDLTVDYGWLWIISEALFWLLEKIHSVVGNWGWSIVLVTVFVKTLFYKLSESSYRSMAGMRKMQPKIQALRERYGDDKQKLSQSMMEMYRKEGINPLGGCLPILVQIPVFLALYWVLSSSVELRQTPFIFWIHDLSLPDPYYVLPLLMGLSMFIQQRLSPPPPDPTQAKVMMMMPVVLTLFFLNFPAGLVLYWVVNNSLSILQQVFITHRIEKYPPKSKAK